MSCAANWTAVRIAAVAVIRISTVTDSRRHIPVVALCDLPARASANCCGHRQAAPQGLLRVSMPTDVAALKLSGLISQFVDTYPDVRLEFDLLPRHVDLLDERFKLALRVSTRLPDDATLVARAID